jgi:hypothetical protein
LRLARTGFISAAVVVLMGSATSAQSGSGIGNAEDARGQRAVLFDALRGAAAERYLGPDVYWRPQADLAWGWYAARPSLGGWHRFVSFHWIGAPNPSDRRLYVRRVRFHGNELARVLDQHKGVKLPAEARGLIDAVVVERSRADETSCPGLRKSLEQLESLPRPSFDFVGLRRDGRGAGDLHVATDGTNVALTIPWAGPHGRVTYSHNIGPVNDWAQRFEAATETCWRAEPSS